VNLVVRTYIGIVMATLAERTAARLRLRRARRHERGLRPCGHCMLHVRSVVLPAGPPASGPGSELPDTRNALSKQRVNRAGDGDAVIAKPVISPSVTKRCRALLQNNPHLVLIFSSNKIGSLAKPIAIHLGDDAIV